MWLKEGTVCRKKDIWGQVLDSEAKVYFFSFLYPSKWTLR